MKPKICRIASLKGYDNVLAGRDFAGIFAPGHVYSVVSMQGVTMLTDLGEHAHLQSGTGLQGILIEGSYMLTAAERGAELKADQS